MRNALIFDVDGTIWDAVEVLTDAWNKTGAKYKEVTTTIKPEDMRPLMGKTMDEFAVLFPSVDRKLALEILKDACVEENEYLLTHPGKLYPEIAEVMRSLNKDYDLYIVSNCQEGYIEALMKSCGIEDIVEDFENYGRTGRGKAENIRILMERCDIKKAIYIGDTELDMVSAETAGIPFIHAAYGYGKIDECRFRISEPKELPEVIRETKYFSL